MKSLVVSIGDGALAMAAPGFMGSRSDPEMSIVQGISDEKFQRPDETLLGDNAFRSLPNIVAPIHHRHTALIEDYSIYNGAQRSERVRVENAINFVKQKFKCTTKQKSPS